MSLDLLVLGGTSWLGGAIARHAHERGHQVTCLARGESGNPPADVTWVRADRDDPGAYDEVTRRDWDAVFDVSWQPDLVRGALAALAPRARHWVYVSSGSVYADDTAPDAGEDAPLHEPLQAGRADWSGYGPAKVACEQACIETMGADRVLAARAGLIGGYGDRSDRLGAWAARVARAADGEQVLVPPTDAACQVIDVEDLATWLVTCAESRTSGLLNAVGDQVRVGDVLAAAAEVAGRRPDFVAADDAWLLEHGVEPWMGEESLALWLPQRDYAGFMTRRNERAKAAGLAFRSLVATMAATLVWEREQGLDRERRAGLTPTHERELLDRLADK